MKYLVIKSQGEIEMDAFKLMGASTKKGEDSKIGHFGSGLKYAIATLIREGVEVRAFSGGKEIKFGLSKRKFRNTSFDVVTINGEETNFTTELGEWEIPDAIRDIFANAVDESLEEFSVTDNIETKAGITSFFIKMDDRMFEFVGDMWKYFSNYLDDVVMEEDGFKVFEPQGDEGTVIYKKGFKVFEHSAVPVFFYQIDDVLINENRYVKYNFDVENMLARNIIEFADHVVISRLIESFNSGSKTYESGYVNWGIEVDSVSDAWGDVIGDKTVAALRHKDILDKFYRGNDYILLPEGLIENLLAFDAVKNRLTHDQITKPIISEKIERGGILWEDFEKIYEFFTGDASVDWKLDVYFANIQGSDSFQISGDTIYISETKKSVEEARKAFLKAIAVKMKGLSNFSVWDFQCYDALAEVIIDKIFSDVENMEEA